jgi:hypothetical protein
MVVESSYFQMILSERKLTAMEIFFYFFHLQDRMQPFKESRPDREILPYMVIQLLYMEVLICVKNIHR